MISSGVSLIYWKSLQVTVWIAGTLLWITLLIRPSLGINLFWNGLIPIAPALLVIGAGVWRNICPLSTTALLSNRFHFSFNKKIKPETQSKINLISVLLLFTIIPIRHVLFNTDGVATFYLLTVISAIAFSVGLVFESKSGWCSGLCPVHPVEKLYGSAVAVQVPNIHCEVCVRCSIPCPDSTSNYLPLKAKKLPISSVIEFLMVGMFPGYIWGWFQVGDHFGVDGWHQLLTVFGYPLFGGAITGVLYVLLTKRLDKIPRREVAAFFAAAAVSCYYWFRLPMLVGFGSTITNGMVIDLSKAIPPWTMTVVQLSTTTFFFWWIVWRNRPKRSWSTRPQYADRN